MDSVMKVHYDALGDILYVDLSPPTVDQIMREVSEGVLLRLRLSTGELEGYEIHGFVARSEVGREFELPKTVVELTAPNPAR
jgi:uncharacterized protein YuzE